MADIDSNPFSAPFVNHESAWGELSSGDKPRASVWRWVAILFCWLIGGFFFVMGMFVISAFSFFNWTNDIQIPLARILLGCALYLGFGGMWLLAGWCFWCRRDRWGVAALLAGAVIPITLFAIFGN